MKKHLLIVFLSIISSMATMHSEAGDAPKKRKKTIFIDQSGTWVIGKDCLNATPYTWRFVKKGPNKANKGQWERENRIIRRDLVNKEGDLPLYNWLKTLKSLKNVSLQYLLDELQTEHSECTWFDEDTTQDEAFQFEMKYMREAKKELKNVPWWQKIWNRNAYKRSQETYELLKSEIDIYRNIDNEMHRAHCNAFNNSFRKDYYTERE